MSTNFTSSMGFRQAKVLVPFTFIEHDPQMPSLQDLLNVREESTSPLMCISASRTIGPSFFLST